jgi:hypothetical protein
MVVHQVDTWISGRDIGPGQRWALALGRELAESHFGIICLTAENLQSPWILFEAGAVSRSLEARVVPLLFGIKPSDLAGPLAQFQSVEADRAGIERLVAHLYDAGNSALDARQKDLVFRQLWPVLEERLKGLADQATKESPVQSPVDLLSELAKSPDHLPATMSEDKGTLERIDQERKRLRRELEYLETEEAKLAKQDAPISLLERAIEPTQHRLAEVDTTIGAALDRVFAELSASQIELLRSLVMPRGTRRVLLPKEQVARRGDLEALARAGLVVIGEDGAEIFHDLVAEYVARRFAAA